MVMLNSVEYRVSMMKIRMIVISFVISRSFWFVFISRFGCERVW